MIKKILVSKIKKHNGPVLVPVNNFNDTYYVQVVKSDFILQLTSFQPDDETGFDFSDEGFIGLDYQQAHR